MKHLFIAAISLTLYGCNTANKVVSNKSKYVTQATGYGDTRTIPVYSIDSKTYRLENTSTDETYAFNPSNPVKVGGAKSNEGPARERKFLNALLGANGEELKYYRSGNCCTFKSPNGLLNNEALLDIYKVYEPGKTDTLTIYINMYDEGDLFIPVGMTAKK